MKFAICSAAAVFATLTLAHPAQSCACCSETADRVSEDIVLESWNRDVLDEIRFGPTAHIFVGACDMECVEGLKNPQYEYSVTASLSDRQLVFNLSAKGIENSTLTFELPKILHQFSVDLEPDPLEAPAPLYKEWRLKGALHSSGGFLEHEAYGIPAELILQGRGNACPHSGDFTHWRLSVKQWNVDFALWGKTATAE